MREGLLIAALVAAGLLRALVAPADKPADPRCVGDRCPAGWATNGRLEGKPGDRTPTHLRVNWLVPCLEGEKFIVEVYDAPKGKRGELVGTYEERGKAVDGSLWRTAEVPPPPGRQYVVCYPQLRECQAVDARGRRW